jgi:hypothetical protein
MMNTLKSRATSVEDRLAGLFKTVKPRQDFVRGLGHKIQVVQPAINSRMTSGQFFVLVLAGVLSLGMLVAWLARLIDKNRNLANKA